MIHYLTIFATMIAVSTAGNNNLDERVDDLIKVDLYYAALCPDAAQFVRQQLVASYEDIGDYINVTYIPYGKGTHENYTDSHDTVLWHFTCQHGMEGCYGNKAHSCAINEILTNSEISNEQQLLVDFVGCLMSHSTPARAVPECLQTVGVDDSHISVVNDCTESIEGDNLLAAHGDKTYALMPTGLYWVPTIVINEVYSLENQADALFDFQGLICQYIPIENQPRACNGSTSLHIEKNIVAMIIFSLVFYIGKEPNHFF